MDEIFPCRDFGIKGGPPRLAVAQSGIEGGDWSRLLRSFAPLDGRGGRPHVAFLWEKSTYSEEKDGKRQKKLLPRGREEEKSQKWITVKRQFSG